MEIRSVLRAAESDDRPRPRQVAPTEQPGPAAATLLALQRAAGNRATSRFVQTQLQRAHRSIAAAPAGLLQRYTDEELKAATDNLKLPGDKVQTALETGEALGIFAEVYEAATSRYNLNPDGFATMLGSFKAIMPKSEEARSKQETAKPRGAGGFLRELLYGLEHIRKGLYVQYGSMAPDALADALRAVGLSAEADMVAKQSGSLELGDKLGGDVVVWGGKRQGGALGETVQHKVVEGADEGAVASELAHAIRQLAGKHEEAAIEGTQRTADLVLLPANAMAKAEPEAIVAFVRGRMAGDFEGKKRSTIVDVVRITGSKCQVEYETKTGAATVVMFGSEEAGASPQEELSAKTPASWEAGAIKRPKSAKADAPPAAPTKPLNEMTAAEVTMLIGPIEAKSGKPFEKMSKSDLATMSRELTETKTKWLATKTAAEAGRVKELEAARDTWVKEQLAAKPEPKEKKDYKEWHKKQTEELTKLWVADHAQDDAEMKSKKSYIDDVQKRIRETGGEDAALLKRFDDAVANCAVQTTLLTSYEGAAKERSDFVYSNLPKEQRSKENVVKWQNEWDSKNAAKVPLVEENAKVVKFNADSIERDKKQKAEKEELNAKYKTQAEQVCKPLLDAVNLVHKDASDDLMKSLIAVLQQTRHGAAIGVLCDEIATQLVAAHKLVSIGQVDKAGLESFTKNLSKHRDYHNLQGDLGEIAQAVRMAKLPPEERSSPVVIGSTAYDPVKGEKQQAQEVDVSFAGQGKDDLQLQEVAWDIDTLQNKLLGTDKTSQRVGYARVINAQKESATGQKVRMTYVVHKAGAGDLEAIKSGAAPPREDLGPDVEVAAGEAGAMAKVLFKRGYFLSLGGRVYSPEEIGAWVGLSE